MIKAIVQNKVMRLCNVQKGDDETEQRRVISVTLPTMKPGVCKRGVQFDKTEARELSPELNQ